LLCTRCLLALPPFSRNDLYQLQEAALAEKKRIRKVLKDFESQFIALHNR